MKQAKLFLMILAVVVLAVTGCKKEDTPTEVTSSTNISNPTGQPMPNFETQADYGGAMASIYYYMASPIAGLPDVATNAASAIFNGGVDAGAVVVNNNSLGKISASGKTYYMAPDVNNPFNQLTLSWNGTNHSWNVAGANGIPAITGSVKSPYDYSVTLPTANTSVAKANGIQVKWSNTSSAKALIQIVNISNKSQVKVYQEVADNGNYTIPAADLTNFSGDCMIFVVKYNYSSTTAGGKKYFFVSEVVKSVNVKVN
jgi:YHS domain-containing protein